MTKEQLFKTGNYLLIAIIIALGAWTISEVLNYKNIRQDYNAAYITVTGTGEASGIPDIATVSFTLDEVGKTAAEGQKMVQDKFAPAKKGLLDLGIDEKDIKTVSYNIYPKYTYPVTPPCLSYSVRCPEVDTTPKLDGYEVTQSISVKVRKIDDTGKVLELLGSNKINQISGPDFAVDNIEGLKADAQEKAIKDAQEKAKKLAKDLGVELVKVTGYDDGSSNGGYYRDSYDTESMYDGGYGMAKASVVPDVPAGESKITKDVSITYEIRD